MKKQYSKPEIEFQSFSLSTRIAGDCEKIIGNPTDGVCGIPGSAPGLDIFSAAITGCAMNDGDADEVYDGFCYHVPTNDKVLFNS